MIDPQSTPLVELHIDSDRNVVLKVEYPEGVHEYKGKMTTPLQVEPRHQEPVPPELRAGLNEEVVYIPRYELWLHFEFDFRPTTLIELARDPSS